MEGVNRPYGWISHRVVCKMNDEVQRRELGDQIHSIVREKQIAAHTARFTALSRFRVFAVHHSKEIGTRNLYV